jgi:uncharacterized protein (TIGR00269 family)
MKPCCKSKPVYRMYNGEDLCRKHFIEYVERKVRKTIGIYKLIGKTEKILVVCSGGKDSTVVLYILNKYNNNPKVKIEAFHIDEGVGGYSSQNTKNIRAFCRKHKIKLHETSFRKEFGYSLCYIRSSLNSRGFKVKSCTICGALRRYLMNIHARKMKATKVVTGHNLDDEAQSVVMNLFKNNVDVLRRLGPMAGVITDKKFVPRIKPLYFCTEEEVRLYSKLNDFNVVYEKCPCSTDAYRRQIGNMLNEFDKRHPGTKHAVINSFLKMLPGLKKEAKGEMKYCSLCGEPANNKLCSVCKIILIVKDKRLNTKK